MNVRPCACNVENHEVTKAAQEVGRETTQIARDHGVEKAVEYAEATISSGYAQAAEVGLATGVTEVSNVAHNSVDGDRDGVFANETAGSTRTSSFLSGFASAPNALDAASEDFGTQFSDAASVAPDSPTIDLQNTPTMDNGFS